MAIDYRDFEGKPKDDKHGNKRWWLETNEEDRAKSITSVVQLLMDQDSGRQAQYLLSAKLYGNSLLSGLNGSNGNKAGSLVPAQFRDRVTYNVIQSASDTLVAKMAKNKPKPLFLTAGGDYKLQRRAKKLDKFVDGIFYENNAHPHGLTVLKDAVILGDGLTKVFAYNGRVKYDRAPAYKLLVDLEESKFGDPRQLHQWDDVDRDILISMFPDKADKIRAAKHSFTDMVGSHEGVSDKLRVVESWHLPSGPKAKDGMRTFIILGGAELHSEEYKKQGFPFARMPWNKRLEGYWSQSGAEQIQNIQLEINRILWVIQQSYRLAGSFKIWMKIGSKIVKEHLNNEIGAIIESDDPPQYLVPPIVPPEMYAQLKDHKNSAFEQFGISQLSANSQKPAGLDSGKALRTYNDIETERFMSIGQAYEDYFLQLAKLSIDVARDLAKEGDGYKVQSPNRKVVESIDWSEVDLSDEDFITQVFPVSSLSSDPAGRLQDIQEYVQAGFISPRTARRLSVFPDIEMVNDLETAKEDYLHSLFEKMIDDGEYTPPEPYDDLQLAIELFGEYYPYAKMNGVEEEKLDLLRQFNDQVMALVQKAMPPPPPPAVNQPQAAPLAPPQSDLVPNVPQAG